MAADDGIDERISCYSNTSKKHRGHLFRAIPVGYAVFEWRWEDGSSYIQTMYDQILNMIDKQSRARKSDYSRSIDWAISQCEAYDILFSDQVSEHDKELLENIREINVQELLLSSAHLIESNKQRR